MSYLYLSDSQLSADILASDATASENPALKPERSTQYEIGIEQRIGAFASLKVEGFYKESKDYLTLANRTDAFPTLVVLILSKTGHNIKTVTLWYLKV